jgi:hypothetical protein
VVGRLLSPKKADLDAVIGKEYVCPMGYLECFCAADEIAE